jgi:hypothetical protein
LEKISTIIKLISNFIKNKKMENFFKDDSSKNSTTQYLVGVGTGLLVLFATVWVVGKAWKKSQSQA